MAIVISGGLVIGTSEAIPLDRPRLLYDNLFRTSGGIVTATSEESAEFAADNAILDPATWNFWRADTLPARIEVEIETAKPADYCLVAAHTLGAENSTFAVEYHDGDEWVRVAETLRGTDAVFAILFPEAFAAKYAIEIDGAAVPSIGVIQLGKSLVLPLGVTLDHAPISLQGRTVIEPNISEGGQWLGRSIVREGVATDISVKHLPEFFVRQSMAPFIAHARKRPFGWAWAPEDHPAEVAYCWTSDDVRPVHGGLPGRLDLSFTVDGLME